MPAANTFECFREFTGQRVTGVLENGLPAHRSVSTKTLIFEDGRGLTICSNGSYWITPADEVERAVRLVRSKLEKNTRDLRDVLDLAGAA